MREISEVEYNEAVERHYRHIELNTRGSTLYLNGVLDAMREIEIAIIPFEFGFKVGNNIISIVLYDHTQQHLSSRPDAIWNTPSIPTPIGSPDENEDEEDLEFEEDEDEEEDEEDTENLHNIELILDEFERGSNENGWTWRSPESLANNIDLQLERITDCLEMNDNVFERSSNGRKYRLLPATE